MSDNGQQVPLIERLQRVPAAARVLEHTHNPLGYDTTSIPVGALCREAADRIAELEGELETAQRERDEIRARSIRRKAALISERDALRADAERFAWWFSFAPKPDWFVAQYLQGAREKFTLDQWRYTIDAARAKEKQA